MNPQSQPPPQEQPQLQKPATPTYILRGHATPIHSLNLYHQNRRLLSGDAAGYLIVWDVGTKRPAAAWKAHDGAILEATAFFFPGGTGDGVDAGGRTVVYSHGRDHKLCVWVFSVLDERDGGLGRVLPVDLLADQGISIGRQPWLLHSLSVNALNFCAFSMAFLSSASGSGSVLRVEGEGSGASPTAAATAAATADGTAEAHAPAAPPSPPVLLAVPNALNSGAIDLFHLPSETRVSTIPADPDVQTGMVMALRLLVRADAIYVLSAFEDGRVMVFRCMKPCLPGQGSGAKSQWHWEKLYACRAHSQPVLALDLAPSAGCFFSSAADASIVKHPLGSLGSGLVTQPLKTVNTKHAGQQGLRVRADGKILATAGWDSRVRVYSCKTLKELAVLRWHKEGCYAVAFAEVQGQVPLDGGRAGGSRQGDAPGEDEIREEDRSLAAVQRLRDLKVQQTHWVAAGSKDGKISLWDIY
ncbi:WD40 repeat domain-containing protein [Aspergillus homomorphus CBS 101889]|uniref:ASTRA-associated protein 1 n=1 Tax=Aspergillus homomorphus (strain CBS 101889) TaxID=1450537 RepID=A0A395I1M6_ASPHC|nr:WD40 repeat-like protein [Aspergillus homomorphus CBS 101889]RAL14081.1 WD40 repeat-like protein [Aspergillus homomorphus CBS 101889]